jgi:hypothetical protein
MMNCIVFEIKHKTGVQGYINNPTGDLFLLQYTTYLSISDFGISGVDRKCYLLYILFSGLNL